VCLPQGEVERVLLALGALDALALVHVVEGPVRQRSVVRVGAHAEQYVAVHPVGMARLEQDLDQLDDGADRLAGQWLGVRAAEAQAVGVGDVPCGHLPREVGAGRAGRLGGGVDLVVHVRDVRHEPHRVTLVLEEALEQRVHDVRPSVADVDRLVDRRPARVDPDPAGIARLERLQTARARVVQANTAHIGKSRTDLALLGGRPAG
jgi:hypothetical protein